MRQGARTLAIELTWLGGGYLLAWLATSALLGFAVPPWGTLDIQLHTTYFVLGWWLVLLVPFLAAAVPLTLVRAGRAKYRQRTTNVVLAGLALLTLLLLGCWAAGCGRGCRGAERLLIQHATYRAACGLTLACVPKSCKLVQRKYGDATSFVANSGRPQIVHSSICTRAGAIWFLVRVPGNPEPAGVFLH